ncbi:MAG TPA: condensation domain-containing protein [Longimicrobium sp.]|nr:condensation domain-containing protein [Longimicrobium sp.]
MRALGESREPAPEFGHGGGSHAPEAAGAPPAAGWSAPVTATEQILAGLWGELLGADRVSARDTFFELGGDSLLATRMGFAVRRALGVPLPTDVLFEPWTLRRLAGWIDARRRTGDDAGAPPPLVRAPHAGPLPLSLLQEFYWMQHQFDPGTPSHNMPYALRLDGALRVPALERAVSAVVRRHEALRTTFPASRGVPVQVVGAPAPVRVPRVDLSALAPATREREARRQVAREAARPFDLERGPLLRTLLLRLDARAWVLLVTVHHIVSDGWSMDVMGREMGALYGAFALGRAPALPGPEVQYGDYAVWQRGWLKGPVLERYAAWWRERLAGARPLDLAGEGPGLPRSGPRRALVFAVPSAALASLRRLGAREGATPFMVLLAAFEVLLVRYTGQEDVTVQTSLAGRGQPELESVIGFFAQMALLRTDLSGDPGFREAVRRVRETTLQAYDHQGLPLVERVGPGVARETAAYERLWRVSFSLEDTEKEPLVLDGLSVEALRGDERTPGRVELLSLVQERDGMRGAFTYRVGVFPEPVVAGAMRHYVEILEQVAADPELRISALVLSPGP